MTNAIHESTDPGLAYIHGAGMDTWIWEELIPLIDRPQLTATFPGRGEEAIDQSRLTLDDYVTHVREQINEWSVEQVVLVTHSIGGVVGLEVAGDLDDRVVGFVGVCSVIPPPGGSFLSVYPRHQQLLQRALMRFVGTKPPASAIRRSLCTGLTEDQTARVVESFVPESRRLYTDRAAASIPECPRLYVTTTNDDELDPALQATMHANLQADEVATIEAGHLPMVSDPRELATIIGEFTDSITAEMP